MTSLRVRRVGTSLAAVVLALALFGGVNWIAGRHWVRGDWTKARLYSLSETTRKVVAGLKSPVRLTVFMARSSPVYVSMMELTNRYKAVSGKIETEFVDPRQQPARAEQLVKEFGMREGGLLVRSAEKKKFVEEDKLADYDFGGGLGAAPKIRAFKGEEALTSAILSVTEAGATHVYFTAGHGEPPLDGAERGRGLAEAKKLLERNNITVSAWNSLGKADLPADASVVVAAGPRAAFLEPESGALQKYLAEGGRLLALLDPVLPSPAAPASDLGLGNVLSVYGVKLGADIVIDPANAVPMVGPETLIANSYGGHAIVRSLSEEGLPVVFPLARSVSKPGKPPEGYTETMLVQTSKDGWGETSLTKLEAVQKDKEDTPGPVAIAVAVESEKKDKDPKASAKTFRLVVIGNSRFATNGTIGNAGNANLLLNAVNWLSGQERLVGIAPKTPEQASLALTRAQVTRIGLFTILGLPAFAVVLGVWVWYRRRD